MLTGAQEQQLLRRIDRLEEAVIKLAKQNNNTMEKLLSVYEELTEGINSAKR